MRCALLAERYPKFAFATSNNPSEWTVPVSPALRTKFAVERLHKGLGYKVEFPIARALDDYRQWMTHYPSFPGGH